MIENYFILLSAIILCGFVIVFLGLFINFNSKKIKIITTFIGFFVIIAPLILIVLGGNLLSPSKPKKAISSYVMGDWYIATPKDCKRAISNNISYTDDSLAKKYNCTKSKFPDYKDGDLMLLDCSQMLGNYIFMIDGAQNCPQAQQWLAERFLPQERPKSISKKSPY